MTTKKLQLALCLGGVWLSLVLAGSVLAQIPSGHDEPPVDVLSGMGGKDHGHARRQGKKDDDRRLAIEDVSPSTTNFPIERDLQHSVSGKVLSIAVSPGGSRLYTGSYAGVWRSDDGGTSWHQLTRPQPPKHADDVPGTLLVPTVMDVALHPRNEDVVLAATAFDVRVPERSKNGIYRSGDAGESWKLVHQFTCPEVTGAVGVGQIVFAPDDPKLVYAAGGCAVAVSSNGGRTWVNKRIPDGGLVWHLGVAPAEHARHKNFIRRIYGAGDNQLWYSEDRGDTWFRDRGSIPQGEFGILGGFPVGGVGNSSQILAVEPGRPDHVYVIVPGILNGPAYYFPNVSDGENCRIRVGCGGVRLWLGDYSAFFSNHSSSFQELPGPPAYFGTSTPSGRGYVVTKETPSGYLLFLADISHVHVSEGRPTEHASWHRLDGRDASQSKRENDLSNKLFVHVDPMAFAVSADFEISLMPVTDLEFPYNQNSELDRSQPVRGTLWMGTDGGIYLGTDGGSAWSLTSGLSNLQIPSKFAGLALPGKPPALYFGVPDNDNFFSLDGGASWEDPVSGCGDCGPFFSDPAQPDRVLEIAGRNNPPGFNLYVSTSPFVEYPNAADPSTVKSVPFPGRCRGGAIPPCPDPRDYIFEVQIGSPFESGLPIDKIGYRPVVLTRAGEMPLPEGDHILIRTKPTGERVLLRTTKISQITSPTDWDTTATEDGPAVKVFQQGPAFTPEMRDVLVVQASGGHTDTVFTVGDPSSTKGLWRWTKGDSAWRRIVPAADESVREARIFFVDPYHPRRLYVVDVDGLKRSEDGGGTWFLDRNLTRMASDQGDYGFDYRSVPLWVGTVIVINDMIFDSQEGGTRFAIGPAGVFFTSDGEHWRRLLSTQALPSYPVSAFFDRISNPDERSLSVAFNGRSLLRLSPIPGP